MRAWHLIGDGEPKVFVDDLGMALVGITKEQVRDLLAAGEVTSTAIWVLRGRFAEDRLERARERGVEQYVILGAGLDTFVLRHANDLGALVVFEVDDPPMQAWKRRRIAELSLPLLEALRFVPCDFETMRIADALEDASFLPRSPAFVSWLGVTQYLTKDAIAETFRWVSTLASGSEIVFTFVLPTEEADTWKRNAAKALEGVRFETFFTPDEITSLVNEAGLTVVELLTAEEANRRYFTNRSDDLQASASELLMVAAA
jgi:methyltransferase (TIGR00027 family)